MNHKGTFNAVRPYGCEHNYKNMPIMKEKDERCLIKNCPRGGHTVRGLCNSCYNKAWILVKQGKTTWEKLEEQGLSTTSRPVGRPKGPFGIAFEEKNKK